MAFRSAAAIRASRFNSATSCNFLEDYEEYVEKKSECRNIETPSKTFAPSSFRCMRKSWFRLRGVDPDKERKADVMLDFAADMGTACHRIIQSNLSDMLKENWVPVEKFLADTHNSHQYQLTASEDSLETKVEFFDIPIRFAVDGILKLNNEYYLLEIKTSEFLSFSNLTQWKSEHEDQVKCYMTLLGLKHCLFLYQDRQHGQLKCYEFTLSDRDKKDVENKFKTVMMCVETCIAPERLPKGDKWCSMCEYKKSCDSWG